MIRFWRRSRRAIWTRLLIGLLSCACLVISGACPPACVCSPSNSNKILLDCSSKNLTTLSFSEIPPNTAEIILSHNHLDVFDLSTLASVNPLNLVKKLTITHCGISSFDGENVSHYFPKLETLDLQHNDLTEIPQNLPESLETLLLSYNKIDSIVFSQIGKLKNLRELFMDHNQLSVLDENCFKHSTKLDDGERNSVLKTSKPKLNNLQKLALNSNQITELASNVFSDLEYLTALSLADNKLTVLKKASLEGLHLLQHLDISQNSISLVEDEALLHLKRLSYLSLHHNQLQTIPKALPMLEWLDLSNNFIHNISEDHKPDIFPIEVFNIAHNPLNCDCNMVWLKELWDRREYLVKHVDIPPQDFVPKCEYPSGLSGETWDLLADDVFTCGNDLSHHDDKPHPPTAEDDARIETGETLQVRRGMATDCAMQLYWILKGQPIFANVVIQYYVFGMRATTSKFVEVAASLREYTIRHLRPETNYIMCIIPKLQEKADPASVSPISVDHCVEITTKSPKPVEIVSSFTLAWYYILGMCATIIAFFSGIGAIAILYGMYAKNTDWSAKYATDSNSESYLDGSTYATDKPVDNSDKEHRD